MNTTQGLGVQQGVIRRPYLSAISWGAIFAGVVVGLSINLVLNLLGIAAGLMSVDISGGQIPGRASPLWAAIWNGVSMLLAAFVGGYVAARMSGLKRRSDGILHGFVAWGATTILLTGLVTAAAGALSNQIFGGLNQGASQSASSAQSSEGDITAHLETLIKGSGDSQANAIDPQSMRALTQLIQQGRRTEAINLMVGSMNFDAQRAAAIIDQLLIVSGSPEAASSEARATADQAVNTASSVTWGIVLAVLLSLVLGLIGGAIGAAGSRRAPQVMTVA
ncbi:MAG TPA: hypothetical protein VM532_12295 [Burkholderiales bacterium]|nr:hypothetical protein [Burkholderiales bacterium]